MFAMPQQHQYAAYGTQQSQAAPRQYSGHGTSSAFSSSANPDEDWTKISDLAERRRIQNRIAQRNYRKKLKRRLEDLERRAGTSDGGSSGSEKATPVKSSKKSQTPKQKQALTPPSKPLNQNQFTPPMHNDDEYLFPHAYDERERSHTPPMFAAYPTYPPPPEEMLMPYSSAAPYRTMTTEAYHQPEYLHSAVPVSLPPLTHFHDAVKREYPSHGDSLGYLHYPSYVPGLDMGPGGPPPYEHSNPHTPPLSHSFDHSANSSESGCYEYPTTPLSMPGSPGMVQQQM